MTKWHPATKLLRRWRRCWCCPTCCGRGTERRRRRRWPPAWRGRRRPRPTRSRPLEPPPAPFVLPPLERFTAVVERPLFSPTRRMPTAAADRPRRKPRRAGARGAGGQGPAEPELRFFGTVRQGGTAAALVTYPATAEVARLRPGDTVGEWQVLSVERNRLELGLGEERRSFEIFGAGMRRRARRARPGQAADGADPRRRTRPTTTTKSMEPE